jgi:hypothetical protein
VLSSRVTRVPGIADSTVGPAVLLIVLLPIFPKKCKSAPTAFLGSHPPLFGSIVVALHLISIDTLISPSVCLMLLSLPSFNVSRTAGGAISASAGISPRPSNEQAVGQNKIQFEVDDDYSD